jgi:hypothetical protein
VSVYRIRGGCSACESLFIIIVLFIFMVYLLSVRFASTGFKAGVVPVKEEINFRGTNAWD